MVDLIKSLLLPPSILVILLGVTALLIPRWYRLGMGSLITLVIVSYMMSAPFSSFGLIGVLEGKYSVWSVDKLHNSDIQAIVVLGSGRNRNAEEYANDDTVSAYTLERLRYAAKLKRETNLPLIVSGGKHRSQDKPEALLMKQALQEDFKVSVEYIETESRTTWENAFETKKILDELKINKVLLVTHAWHMPRSVQAFQKAGINVVPAPTAFYKKNHHQTGLRAFLPNEAGSRATYFALHEILGRWWYGIKSLFVADPEQDLTPPTNTGALNPAGH